MFLTGQPSFWQSIVPDVPSSLSQETLALHELYVNLTLPITCPYLSSPLAPPMPLPPKCHLHRSIHPVIYNEPLDVNDWTNDMERRFAAGIAKGRRDGYIHKGSTIVVLSGWKPGPTNTNTIRISQVEY